MTTAAPALAEDRRHILQRLLLIGIMRRVGRCVLDGVEPGLVDEVAHALAQVDASTTSIGSGCARGDHLLQPSLQFFTSRPQVRQNNASNRRAMHAGTMPSGDTSTHVLLPHARRSRAVEEGSRLPGSA